MVRLVLQGLSGCALHLNELTTYIRVTGEQGVSLSDLVQSIKMTNVKVSDAGSKSINNTKIKKHRCSKGSDSIKGELS